MAWGEGEPKDERLVKAIRSVRLRERSNFLREVDDDGNIFIIEGYRGLYLRKGCNWLL